MPDTRTGTITSVTGQARQMQAGLYSGTFYGAGDPLPPVMPDQPARQWDFAPGTNMTATPRHTEPFNFRHLRAFANVELVRMAIETRKDQLERLDWMVKPRDNKANRKSSDRDPRCLEVEKFLAKPDGQTHFQPFFRALEEDLLALDAACLERVRTRAGKLIGLELVDGSTINLLVDNSGRRPRGDDAVAFQQVIRGMVWANLTNKDLIYAPRNLRTGHIYGFSPVEQIIVTINTIIRRQARQLAYFTEGNVPQGILNAPETWTNEQIRDLQTWFDERISGNAGQQQSVIWTPAGAKYQAFKDAPIKDEFDEWLARLVSNAFSLPPTPFIRQMNKGTAGEDQERALEEGLEPLKLWRKRLIDEIISVELGCPDLEFVFRIEREIDPKVQSEIDNLSLRNGSATIDEVRDNRGLDPLEDGTGEKPRIYFSDGAMTLDLVDTAADNKANPPEPMVSPPAPRVAGAPAPAATGKPAATPKKKVSKLEQALGKYSPDQPRDDHGRWEGGGTYATSLSKDELMPTMAAMASNPDVHQNIIGMTVDGKAIFNPDASLGLSREDMPQIPDELRADFLAQYEVQLVTVDPTELGPTQAELDSYKVGLSSTGKFAADPPIVSSDKYVIDGHHHWAGAVVRAQVDSGTQLLVHQVSADRDTLMRDALAFDSAHGIHGEGIADKVLLALALAKYDPNQPRDEHGRWTSGGLPGQQLSAEQLKQIFGIMSGAHPFALHPGEAASLAEWDETLDHAAWEKPGDFSPARSVGAPAEKYSDSQPRDDHGRFASGGGGDSGSASETPAQRMGLVDSNGAPTEKGLEAFTSNWIGGNWAPYQHAAESSIKGETKEDWAARHPGQEESAAAARELTESIMAKINDDPALDYPLYRGLVGVDYKVGDTFSESLTTWTAKEDLARNFAHDEYNTAGTGDWGHADGIVIKVAGSEMHGFNITQLDPNLESEHPLIQAAAEHITSGQYRVTSVEGEGDAQTYNVERIGPAKPGDLKKVIPVDFAKYSDDQPRDDHGRWTGGGGGGDANVLYEVGPNPDNAELTASWNSLSDAQRAAVTDKLSAEMTPQVMAAIGATGTVEPALGGFEGEVNPALVMSVNEGDPFKVAGAIGDTFGQKAMVVMNGKPMEGLEPVGMVSVSVPGASAETLRGMQGQIGDLADGFTYRNGQMQILNFSGKSDAEFAHAVDARLNGAYVVGHGTVYSAYIEANDYERPANDNRGNAWSETAGSLRAAFSQRLGEEIRQAKKVLKALLAKAGPPRDLIDITGAAYQRIRKELQAKLGTKFEFAKEFIGEKFKELLSQQQNQQAAIGHAVALIDLIDLSEVLNLHEPLLDAVAAVIEETVPRALAVVGVPEASMLVDQVSNAAAEYASTRAAELVSLNGDESLIASTRDMLRNIITQGIEDNIGRDAIAANIRDGVAFSEARANTIATTEVSMANAYAKKTAWDALDNEGATLAKTWYITANGNCCDECEGNADQGEIPYEDVFESGDDMEPAHPNCQCAVAVRVINPGNSAAQVGEEE